MDGFKQVSLALATAGLLASGVAQAALHDRGGGLIYDDVLNITWLQDANYAKTSGYDADGRIKWIDAMNWVSALSYGGYDDWRLPMIRDTGSPGCNPGFSGTDCGWNVQTRDAITGRVYSELAYMFYVNLGNKGPYDAAGNGQGGYGIVDDPLNPNDESLFSDLRRGVYWSGQAVQPFSVSAWSFNMLDGYQSAYEEIFIRDNYAWPVRTGDVAAPIPEPETYAMMLAGLGLLGVMTRRRKQKLNA